MTTNNNLDIILNDFMITYYKNMSNGVNNIIPYLDQNVKCSINNQNYLGSYNLLVEYGKKGILKFEFHNLIGTIQIINTHNLLITCNGLYKVIGFWGQTSQLYKFTDTFVLQYNNGSVLITNYIHTS